jgi:hypothetical protein
MVKRGGGGLFILIFVSKEGILQRGLKERGLNIEITVPPFLPLPSQTCCRRVGNCRVKAWISRSMYCM